MLEVISALCFRELVEGSTAEFPELVNGSFSSIAEQFLQLGKSQLDRIQVRRVGWQVAQLGTGGLNRFANTGDLVAGEIVHHYDVARFQSESQMLLDPTAEQRPVDGPLDGERSDESFRAQCTEEGGSFPATVGNLFHQPRAKTRTAIAASHIGLGPRFIDENNFGGINLLLRRPPLSTLLGDIGTILLFGNQSLFFRDCSSARQALQIVIRQTSSPRSCFSAPCSSRRYMSGRAVIFATNQSAQACHFG